jgi:hypothetical protein
VCVCVSVWTMHSHMINKGSTNVSKYQCISTLVQWTNVLIHWYFDAFVGPLFIIACVRFVTLILISKYSSLFASISFFASDIIVLFSRFDSLVGPGLLYEVPQSHSNTSQSVGLLWPSDRLDAETSTWQYTTLRQTSMAPAGFKPALPAREGLQTNVFDRPATGIGRIWLLGQLKFHLSCRSRTLFPNLVSSHCNMQKKVTGSDRLLSRH